MLHFFLITIIAYYHKNRKSKNKREPIIIAVTVTIENQQKFHSNSGSVEAYGDTKGGVVDAAGENYCGRGHLYKLC